MASSLRKLNAYLQDKRYTRQQAQKNAIDLMELQFEKERYAETLEQRAKTEGRAAAKFDDYETSQRVVNIEATASPFIETLKNPLQMTEQEFTDLNKQIELWKDDKRYADNSIEKAAWDTQIEVIDNQMYLAKTYMQAARDFGSLTSQLQDLIKYDETGSIQGQLSSENTASIVQNSKNYITSAIENEQTKLAEAMTKQKDVAVRRHFVMTELEHLSANPPANPLMKENIERATRAYKRNDWDLAYSLLARPGQAASDAKYEADILTDAQTAAQDSRRALLDNLKQVTGSLTLKEAGDTLHRPFKNFHDGIVTTKTSYLGDEEGWKNIDNLFFKLVKAVMKEDEGWLGMEDTLFSGDVLEEMKSITKNMDLEMIAGVLSGYISHKGDGEFVWADGTDYSIVNTGTGQIEKVPGNQFGEYDFDPVRYRQEVEANIGKLGYTGDAAAKATAMQSASLAYLGVNPNIEFRTLDRERTGSQKYNPENLDSESARLIEEGQKTRGEVVADKIASGDESTSKVQGMIGFSDIFYTLKSMAGTNAKVLLESPDGRQEWIRAKEYQALRSVFDSDSSMHKGMKVKMISGVKDKIKKQATDSSLTEGKYTGKVGRGTREGKRRKALLLEYKKEMNAEERTALRRKGILPPRFSDITVGMKL